RLHLEKERQRGADYLCGHGKSLINEIGAAVDVLAEVGGVAAAMRITVVDQLAATVADLGPVRRNELGFEAAVVHEGGGHCCSRGGDTRRSGRGYRPAPNRRQGGEAGYS